MVADIIKALSTLGCVNIFLLLSKNNFVSLVSGKEQLASAHAFSNQGRSSGILTRVTRL